MTVVVGMCDYSSSDGDESSAVRNESPEITKFLSFAQNVIATVNDVAATGNSIETWRIDSHIR